MSQDLVVHRFPQIGSGPLEYLFQPIKPERAFALVIDYTSLTMEELDNIRTLIGGGNGPVMKLDHTLLLAEETARLGLTQLVRALLTYRCHMLFLLVPCEMPGIESVMEVMKQVTRQQVTVCLQMGREVYAWEMAMTIDPMSEGDTELRRDPLINSPEAQWTAAQPWFGEDLASMIRRLEEQ